MVRGIAQERDCEVEKPTCPLFARHCGGCPMLDLPYEKQLAQKQAMVQKLLGRFAPVEPILAAQEPLNYRNKAIATFAKDARGRLICGTYAAGTHQVLPAADCLLQAKPLNSAIAAVLTAARQCHYEPFDEDRGTGLLRHVLVRWGHASGQILVVLVTAQERLPGSRNFVSALRAQLPELTALVQNVNPRRTSAVLGTQEKILYGPGKILDTLCGLRFSLSPRSFYQVNSAQTEHLYAKALELAELDGRQTVLDAYCGIGTIGLCAAAKAKRVVGVEVNRDAVRDAAANARRNGIANAHFFCADAAQWMQGAAQQGLHPDVVFLDPPREGSTPECLGAAMQMAPRRIIYISCNPETLARDVRILTAQNYRAVRFAPVDMFPGSTHVEVIVLLTREK